ncbi:unnamed protein product [Brassica rapa subsp. narinosa]
MEEGEEAAGAELKRLWSSNNAEDGTMEEEDDSDHKRAKVHSALAECRSASGISSDASGSSMERTVASSSRTDTAMFCQNFILNHGRKDDDSQVYIDLTADLLHVVFSFLNSIDLCRSAMVCRQWRVASAHEDFWKVFNFQNMRISIKQFEIMCHRYPNATKVNLYGVPSYVSNTLAMQAATTLRNLEVLIIGKGRLFEEILQVLRECNRLRSVTISEALLGTGPQETHLIHDRLRELKIIKCRVMRLDIRCQQLRSLSLKGSNMALAMLHCPLLQHLDIASCSKLLDVVIRSAVTSCPLLESLDVSKCSNISNGTLGEIAQACAGLRRLNASNCPSISFELVHLPMLTVLKLRSCISITSASMTWIANSPALEVLELDNCNMLTSVALHLSFLRSLRLVNCPKFTELNLQSTMLSSITISKCPALQRVTITSNALRRLAIKKQKNLTTLVLQCPSLQEVNLTGCKSLSNTAVFSDDGGCPMLKSLILDNCESLTEVRFCNSTLSSLSLVGCRAVTSLALNCPRLEGICLDGCDHLKTVFFKSVAVRSLNLGICPKLSVLSIEAPYMVSLDLKCFGGLSEASIICPLLTSLDASFCGKLRDDSLPAITASCPLIESLLLVSCSSIGSDGFSSLKGLQNLIVLDLSYTWVMNLEPIFKSCIELKVVLKLQACKDLTDSSLEPLYKEGALPALEELDLSYGTLCRTVIADLLACCTHLTHLNLNGCENMHDLDWGSTSVELSDYFGVYNSSENTQEESAETSNWLLQNLNCVGCPNIRKVLIPAAARFDHLSSLNLSLCVNLKEVDLACSNLVLLNLSNCCSLEVLKLGCPRLSTLFLQSCKMDEAGVEAAISGCCSLQILDLRLCPKISPVSMARFQTVCPSLKRVCSRVLIF